MTWPGEWPPLPPSVLDRLANAHESLPPQPFHGCSFCGTAAGECRVLVEGKGGARICGECVLSAADIARACSDTREGDDLDGGWLWC